MSERWHLVATAPRRERYAAAELEQADFATHLPLVLEPVRHGRRTIDEHRPLFPGYVFVRFDPADGRWAVIYRTKGCIQPVRIAGALAALTAEQFDALCRLEDADGLIRHPRPVAVGLTPGETVRVVAGPWSGFLGQVLSMKGAERVRLLLGVLEVEMATGMVDRVAAHA
jgi:transcriptional antiterminator RfaH